jgi:hypothetical protein
VPFFSGHVGASQEEEDHHPSQKQICQTSCLCMFPTKHLGSCTTGGKKIAKIKSLFLKRALIFFYLFFVVVHGLLEEYEESYEFAFE